MFPFLLLTLFDFCIEPTFTRINAGESTLVKKIELGTSFDEEANERKHILLTKNWSRNGAVMAGQNYFFVKRTKVVLEFNAKLNRPNEMPFYVYYGPRSSGKTSLMMSLLPPTNGHLIM